MKHLGDITKISGADVPPVDCVIGGSPCQDLSIAGGRKGLAGERSGLFMEQIRIVKEMREHSGRTDKHVRPRYMVWENVHGAFSSNKGEDFRVVLEEVARVREETIVIPGPEKWKWTDCGCILGDGFSIAWRVFDAQHWGVPQRRKRICLVADFDGHSAADIIFNSEYRGQPCSGESKSSAKRASAGRIPEVQSLSESLSRYFEKGIEAWKEPATDVIHCTDADNRKSRGDGSPLRGCEGIFTFQERGGKPGGKGILIQDDRTGALTSVNQYIVYRR